MYFESHAHYDDEKFDKDREQLIEEMHKNGVEYIINAGSDVKSSELSIKLAEKFSFVYAAVGVHPHEVEKISENDIEDIKKIAQNKNAVAIGEIGLDYHYDFSPRELQRKWFIRQLELAKELNMPVVVHSREASEDCFKIIKESNISRGVIHSYSGSVEMAVEYVKMGFYVGIGGMVTFKNAKKPVEVVKNIPINKILIETDSPYLSPEPKRGTRNNSQNLSYIVDKIAQIKQIQPSDVARITMQNGLNLFSLK